MTQSATSRHLTQLSTTSPYVAYAYSYPHKTAYRPLQPPRSLRQVWQAERKDQLFLYIHIPFCEMRCGFCNLFTTANPRQQLIADYLRALKTQAALVRDAIGDNARIARMAIGGGTPTFLEADEILDLLQTLSREYAIVSGGVPTSVETSPRTATRARLEALKSFGVSRISIGIQSFIEAEVKASGRAQRDEWVDRAISLIRDLKFATLNLDLIYGLPGQTVNSWLYSLRAAMAREPEEMYLYPLYVRPLTGLDRRGEWAHDALRLDCYRAARDMLVSSGYRQISMRLFQRQDHPNNDDSLGYCCQDDGMIGLGCGARSYTRALHYSAEFAVGAGGVREIIADFIRRDPQQMRHVDYGCELDEDEQRRRWVIKSLFRMPGVDRAAYAATFGNDVLEDFPQMREMLEGGYLQATGERLTPTVRGLEWSDALAPALYSHSVMERAGQFPMR